MATDLNQRYWVTKELLDLLSDALFVGELTEDDIDTLHRQLCRAATYTRAVRFFKGDRRGVRLRAILNADAKREVKEGISRLKKELELKNERFN